MPNFAPRRRDLLKAAGALPLATPALAAPMAVALRVAPGLSDREPVARALQQFTAALKAKGVAVKDSAPFLLAVTEDHGLNADGFALTPQPDGLSLSGNDTRGLVYGLGEITERVEQDGAGALHLAAPVMQRSPNAVRSVARAFCSEIEDKPWYYDQEFWREYLDLLVACRFNRFNFFYGIAYDFPRDVTDDYFHFPYPYLLTVPGYAVRAEPLAPGEREKNLAALKFIAAETVARGLDFQLGLWTHAYQWTDSPNSTHHIVGLTPATHAAYCRDALALLLKEVPQISGLTLRVHGESGIPEGSYDFWRTVFSAVKDAGRPIEIDMHAKGTNQTIIDIATDATPRVKLGAKYSAEHQSLGYHQADIRPDEYPRVAENAVFAQSEGDRRFTRYGYGDLYQEGRKYDVLYRLWPGTQHHLLWGDPAMAAAYGRSANFCGAAGLELMEPLTFKGREGTGHPGGRCAYADASLDPGVRDFRKFAISYRIWGRLLYNPDAAPAAWRHAFSAQYGSDAAAAETALAHASRILPLMTSAHLPSAANRNLSYEMAANMPIVPDGDVPYADTAEPKVYSHASPLDPQLFARIDEHVAGLLGGRTNPKSSPAEVAGWLDGVTMMAEGALTKAGPGNQAFRQLDEDVRIVAGMGRFYAAKLRAAMLYEAWKSSGDPKAAALAAQHYAAGRAAWAAMARRAARIYVADVSYGMIPQRRGHWQDRLAGIDKDLAAMKAAIAAAPARNGDAAQAITAILTPPVKPVLACSHMPPAHFVPGAALKLVIEAPDVRAAMLHYRHVNQGERWRQMPMARDGSSHGAAIPADYTQSPYPLQYYFEMQAEAGAVLYPVFNATLSNQPYFAVWRRA